jgi:adenosylcobinamide-GDP ribazoletransferase
MISLLAAVQFLTIAPPLIRRAFTPQEMGRAVGFFPLVGLMLGILLLALERGLRLVFPAGVVAVLVVAAWVALTRGLHLDGLMDTCDGLFGGFTAEKRLEIMRDSRVGAFGMAGGTLMLLGKYAAVGGPANRAAGLLLAPVLARWAMALALVVFPYARSEGLGRDMKDHAHWPQAALATTTALVAAWLVAGWVGLGALALAGLSMLVLARLPLARIPGLTGDTYGAVCEVVELLVLLVFTTAITPQTFHLATGG